MYVVQWILTHGQKAMNGKVINSRVKADDG